MSKIAIIDIDSMFYQSTGKPTFEECVSSFREKFQNLLEKTQCTHYAAFTSKGKTFRHQISKEYKANRTQQPPKYLQAIKEWAIEEYNINVCNGYEADDAIKYWVNQDLIYGLWAVNDDSKMITFRSNCFNQELEEIEKIICSPDKDILFSIPGRHFNYSYKLESKDDPNRLIKGWFVDTSQEDAVFSIWYQMVMNDNSDNVKCLFGKGKAWCDKNFAGLNLNQVRNLVFDEYIKEYGETLGIYKFSNNYRLLHILDSNEDFIREVGELPPFLKINEVKVYNNEVICEF